MDDEERKELTNLILKAEAKDGTVEFDKSLFEKAELLPRKCIAIKVVPENLWKLIDLKLAGVIRTLDIKVKFNYKEHDLSNCFDKDLDLYRTLALHFTNQFKDTDYSYVDAEFGVNISFVRLASNLTKFQDDYVDVFISDYIVYFEDLKYWTKVDQCNYIKLFKEIKPEATKEITEAQVQNNMNDHGISWID